MEIKDFATRPYLGAVDRFARDESGVATIFACFMIMMMVLVGGIGVDLMHAEMERTRLQNTLDRAVLAAADLDQTLDPNDVVADYFEKSGMEDNLISVTVSSGLNYRTVEAQAETLTETQFMHLMGVEELKAPGRSAAEERISKVEVSLVLDISGSMEWNSKIQNLRDAADAFVTQLIRAETQNLISISLIPYSEHVNIGPDIFNQLNTIQRHNFSHCVEVPDSEFSSASLNTTMTYDQAQHFQWNFSSSEGNRRDDTVCPRYSYERILPFSQNLGQLQGNINSLQPRAGTSIFMAVKWGAALLDPSTRGIISNLAGSGTVDNVFSGRPADYSDPETLKTMIVMTDGKNDRSNRISGWAYDAPSEYVHWDNYNLNFYLNYYVNSAYHHMFTWQKYDAATGDTLTDSICTAAKSKGIIIWGVGFEVDSHGESVLKSCASSPSHYFGVEGVEISEAFKSIASQINQLRLTQ